MNPSGKIQSNCFRNLNFSFKKMLLKILSGKCRPFCLRIKVDSESPERVFNRLMVVTLTHWGRVTHICVGNLTITGSDNGLSPGRRQAIIWTNAGILLIGTLGANFSGILIGIQTFSYMKMHLKMSSAKWRPFCLGLNVLKYFWLPVMEILDKVTMNYKKIHTFGKQ